MKNDTKTVQACIIQILRESLGITESIDLYSIVDMPLTGSPIFLSGFDMVYLLFELEKRYNIRIHENAFCDYRFNTINIITEDINKKITNL